MNNKNEQKPNIVLPEIENNPLLNKKYLSVKNSLRYNQLPSFLDVSLNSPAEIKEYFLKFHPTMRDKENRYRLSSLFFETRNATNLDYPTIFTMKEKDHTSRSLDRKGLTTYISFKRLYLIYDHIPYNEYEMALDIFGSWDHWLAICKSSSFKEYVESLRNELSVRLRSKAIKNLIELSTHKTPTGAAAARYLADEGYIPKKLGRITKEEKLRQTKIAAGVREDLASDMARLGLEIVNGNK